MALTNLQIVNAKPGMYADGNGLYLLVKPSGSRSWVLRFQMNGRRQDMGLGSFSVLSAVEARAEAARLKADIANGINPLQRRLDEAKAAAEAAKAAAEEQARKAATFRFAAEQHIADKEAGWRNAKHRQQWTNTLATYVFPTLGDLPVSEITPHHILDVLRPIWSTKPETASRVRMRIEAVLNSAKVNGWRSGENPAIWRGGLEASLPATSKVKRVRHHPALPWQEAPAFMRALVARDGISARALEFCILTAARSGEVRKAKWSEIDLNESLWVVPADRMKAGREHRVPLSEAALNVLRSVPRIEGCALLFPGLRNQPLSDMTLGAVLKRMSYGQFTVHGFRSTFRDWVADQTSYAFEVAENALAHTIPFKAVKSYLRTDSLEKRRPLMEDWASWLSTKQ